MPSPQHVQEYDQGWRAETNGKGKGDEQSASAGKGRRGIGKSFLDTVRVMTDLTALENGYVPRPLDRHVKRPS